MTEEQIARLDLLGMIWENKYEKQWSNTFQALCNYYRNNSNFDIPIAYQTESGIKLGAWIRHQRDEYEKGKLSEERIKKLRAIGFTLEKSDPWKEKFLLAKSYFEEHGDLNIPKDYIVGDFQLGVWLRQQKSRYKSGNMPNEHFELLTSIGMDWENALKKRVTDSYETGFQHLETFLTEHSVDSIMNNTVCDDGYRLGNWIANCKTKYRKGKLSQKHISHFEQLGITLEKSDPWEERYQEVKAFLEKNGGTYISKGTRGESGCDLFLWVADQRKYDKKGLLSADRKKKLVEIGYPFLKNGNGT